MTPPARSLPQATESVCPVCLRRIPAEYVLVPAEEGIPSVLLRKECPEHGVFSVPVWRGMPDFPASVRGAGARLSFRLRVVPGSCPAYLYGAD